MAAQARIALRAAADRASALGSHEQAVAYLQRAHRRHARPGRGGRAAGADREPSRSLGGRLTEAEATFRKRGRGTTARRAIGAAEIRAMVGLADALSSSFQPTEALDVLVPLAAEVEATGDDDARVSATAASWPAHTCSTSEFAELHRVGGPDARDRRAPRA